MANKRRKPNPKGYSSHKDEKFDKDEMDPKPRKGKGRKPRNQSDSSPTSGADRYANDPAWWMKQGQLAKDAATFSTFNATGAPYKGFEMGRPVFTPAGIARYDYIPFFGDIDSVVHPLNVSAKLMYDMVNAKNSRNSSYDPSDLMLYTVCVANAWVIHSFIQRIVGFYTTFDPMNRYWWVPLMESMGVSHVSVQHDIVAWRNLANRIAVKLNMLSVPNGISYYQREMFMCNGVYMDAPTVKASMYYFSPAALFKWEYDDEGKGKAVLHQTPWYSPGALTSVTPADVEAYFNDITENLFNDSDITSMGADVIKAYGRENCFALPYIDETFAIAPAFRPEVNLQLHNARICSLAEEAATTRPYKLVQDMDRNIITASYNTGQQYGDPSFVFWAVDQKPEYELPLDFFIDNPTVEDFIEATRLLYHYTPGTYKMNCCTELLIDDTIFTFESNPTTREWTLTPVRHNTVVSLDTAAYPDRTVPQLSARLAAISKFDNGPLTYVAQRDSSSSQFAVPKSMRCVSDLTNFSTMSGGELDTLNEACTLSIFMPSTPTRG